MCYCAIRSFRQFSFSRHLSLAFLLAFIDTINSDSLVYSYTVGFNIDFNPKKVSILSLKSLFVNEKTNDDDVHLVTIEFP